MKLFAVVPFIVTGVKWGKPVTWIVKQNPRLLKLARETFEGNKQLRDEANALIKQLTQDNMNPGIGTKPIGKSIFEARSSSGARVYFRNAGTGVEILGYSNKGNQDEVIRAILKTY